MDISLPVAERTTTGTVTKEATDSSVSITADWGTSSTNVTGTSDGCILADIFAKTTENREERQEITLEGNGALVPISFDGTYLDDSINAESSNPNVSVAQVTVGTDKTGALIRLYKYGNDTETTTLTVSYKIVTVWSSPTSRTVNLNGIPTGYDSYSLVSYSVDSGTADIVLAADGQKVTISNWSGTTKPPRPEDWIDTTGVITVTAVVRCTNRYITGYSGYASVSIEDTAPYDIAVSSVSSSVTSHSTPYYSNGYIRCTLYANYSTNASVTFSYKVDTTVTEKYFNVNFDGVDVEEVNFNGVDLDPNA